MITGRTRTTIEDPNLAVERPLSAESSVASRPRLTRHALRKFWLQLHLYLGLFAGGLFVFLSLTGSVLVFYIAIDEWLNPETVLPRGVGEFRPLDEIVAAADEAHQGQGRLETLQFPHGRREAMLAWYKVAADDPEQVRWLEVRIDPATATVLGSNREWGNYLVSFIYELHRSLFLHDRGETVVGVLALLLMVSVGTGLHLWWPSPGKFHRAITLKREASPIRVHYDLHKLSGLAGSVVLLILAFTGVYLEFPKYVVPLVTLFSPVQDFPKEKELRSTLAPGSPALSAEQVARIAEQTLPGGVVTWMGFPNGPDGVYGVGLRQPGEVRQRVGHSQVWIDQYSGAVLHVLDWRRFTAGETFIAWLFPLHNGEAFGLPGRVLVCITGVVPAVLYVTALRMWWLKRAAHRRQRESPATLALDVGPVDEKRGREEPRTLR